MQVVQFANSLVDARSELQHKYVLKPANSDSFSCCALYTLEKCYQIILHYFCLVIKGYICILTSFHLTKLEFHTTLLKFSMFYDVACYSDSLRALLL